MANLDSALTTTQRLLILSFLFLTFALSLINQQGGVIVALFLMFLSARLKKNWSKSRGHTILPAYFRAVGVAGLNFYISLLVALIVFVSVYDDEFLESAFSIHSASATLTPLPMEIMEVGAIAMTSIFLLFISTLIRITWHVSKGRHEPSGSFMDTFIAICLTISSQAKRFSIKLMGTKRVSR